MFHWQEFKEKALQPVLDFLSRRLGQHQYFVANRVNVLNVNWWVAHMLE